MSMYEQDWKTIQEWNRAVNEGEATVVASLTTEDVAIHGPRGVAVGREAVVDWVARSRVHLEVLSTSTDRGSMIAECRATWPANGGDSGEGRMLPVVTILVFQMRDRQIASIRRFGSLDEAQRDLQAGEGAV